MPQHDNDKKMLRILTIIFGLCLALNLSKPAFSQQLDGKILSENDCSSDAFLIPSIMIDSEGVTGTEARDIGIKQATIDAFATSWCTGWLSLTRTQLAVWIEKR